MLSFQVFRKRLVHVFWVGDMSLMWKWHEHSTPEELVGGWDMLGQEVFCPECGKACTLEYDETFDDDTGDTYDYWILVEEP